MYLWLAGQDDGDCQRPGVIVEISPSPGQARPGREGVREDKTLTVELFCRYFFVTRGTSEDRSRDDVYNCLLTNDPSPE